MMWRDFEGKDRIVLAIWKLNAAIRVLYMKTLLKKGHHKPKTRFLQSSGWRKIRQETGFFQWTHMNPEING
jgi:hypothetical protein